MKFTIAPTIAPTPSLPIQAEPREAASIWMSGVVAPFVQNVEGGLGVAVLTFLIREGRGVEVQTAIISGLIVGGAVFGAACAIRAFRDEVQMLVAMWAGSIRDETQRELLAENKRLTAEVERLKSEGMVAHAWGGREAAEKLVLLYYAAMRRGDDSGKAIAREAAMQAGMTRPEWEHGVQFLRNAEVLERGARGGIWLAVSEEAAMAMIARHAAESRVSVRAANGDMAAL